MLWQGERALAEIAGPSTPGTRPLSEVVAADYLQFADDMGQVESPRRTRLLDELKVLQDFGRTGLAATVDQLLLPDAQSATNIRINSGARFPRINPCFWRWAKIASEPPRCLSATKTKSSNKARACRCPWFPSN